MGVDVMPHEVDYLLGQALSLPDEDGTDEAFEAILQMKTQLVESAILSRLLDRDDLTLEELKNITTELVATQKEIETAFKSLSDFETSSAAALATPSSDDSTSS